MTRLRRPNSPLNPIPSPLLFCFHDLPQLLDLAFDYFGLPCPAFLFGPAEELVEYGPRRPQPDVYVLVLEGVREHPRGGGARLPERRDGLGHHGLPRLAIGPRELLVLGQVAMDGVAVHTTLVCRLRYGAADQQCLQRFALAVGEIVP